MTEICKYESCTGCGACQAVCPVQAVALVEAGFRGARPVIDQDKCIDCGKCRSVCPVCVPVRKNSSGTAYAAYAVSEDERKSSASGGMASVLAETVISEGGVVYGCAQLSAGDIRHVRIDKMEDISLLKGSKYVQSDMTDTFCKVRKDIDDDRKVLFVGTPCQVSALKNYVGNKDSGLVTADLCCHGVPPGVFLRRHLAHKGLVPERHFVSFRRNDRGKIEFGFGIKNEAKDLISWSPSYWDSFMTGFLSGLFFRENCFSCPYASHDRCGDVTLADCWGVDAGPEMTHRKGLSAILINTESGRSIFEKAEKDIVAERMDVEAIWRSNGQFNRPFDMPEGYGRFIDMCETEGYVEACRKYMPLLKRRLFFAKMRSWYYKWPFRQYIRRKLKRTR